LLLSLHVLHVLHLRSWHLIIHTRISLRMVSVVLIMRTLEVSSIMLVSIHPLVLHHLLLQTTTIPILVVVLSIIHAIMWHWSSLAISSKLESRFQKHSQKIY
jgi:hypothetical protein